MIKNIDLNSYVEHSVGLDKHNGTNSNKTTYITNNYLTSGYHPTPFFSSYYYPNYFPSQRHFHYCGDSSSAKASKTKEKKDSSLETTITGLFLLGAALFSGFYAYEEYSVRATILKETNEVQEIFDGGLSECLSSESADVFQHFISLKKEIDEQRLSRVFRPLVFAAGLGVAGTAIAVGSYMGLADVTNAGFIALAIDGLFGAAIAGKHFGQQGSLDRKIDELKQLGSEFLHQHSAKHA